MPRPRAARRMAAVAFRWLMRIVPARRQVFVASFPPDEGNAVEVVRALIDRYPGTIVWADSPTPDRLRQLGLDPDRIVAPPKRSPGAILAFLRSEAVFNTHGVYGCPRPVRGKALVNLWHGDGPKGHAGAPIPSTVLVSGSGVFGRRLAKEFGVSTADLLLTGLPRTRQLRQPAGPEVLGRLGLDATVPFVIWMPTVRQFSAAGLNDARSDTADPRTDADLVQLLVPGATELAKLGIRVVVKPHPADIVSRRFLDFQSISDADLVRAGTTLYAVLGASSGLLTDYSSVWTDYLALDRPMAFFMPDLEAYQRGRGILPEALEHLPGPILTSADDFVGFGREVAGATDGQGSALRRQSREFFEILHPDEPADQLLDELERRSMLVTTPVGVTETADIHP